MSKTLVISENFPPKKRRQRTLALGFIAVCRARITLIAAGEDPRQDEFDSTHGLRMFRILSMPTRGMVSFRGCAVTFADSQDMALVQARISRGLLRPLLCRKDGWPSLFAASRCALLLFCMEKR